MAAFPAFPAIDEKLRTFAGVEIQYEEEWVGEVGKNRHPEPRPEIIRQVRLPFTPAEWWELTTREGGDYIGPCCGTTGAMQDILCAVYRDGGWISGSDFLELGMHAESHPDGFENWNKKLSEKQLNTAIEKWSKVPNWDRIGIIYRALKDRLRPGIQQELWPRTTDLTEKDVLRILHSGLRYLKFQDVFGGDKDPARQLHANRVVTLARVLPAAKLFFKTLAGYQPFTGVAIVSAENPEHVIDNHQGLCLYKSEEDAQEVIRLSTRGRAERGKFKTRPVLVSVEEGLVFMDEDELTDEDERT